MRVNRLSVILTATAIVGCTSAVATNFRPPLEAKLSPGAKTGAPIPLRIDPNAKVVIATVPNLPPAPYSDAQAARGERVYDATCATCHQSEKFIGPQFAADWNDRRVGDFYQLIRSSMPVDNPGGLKDQEYLDIVAYLLKANHAPAGADSVSADTTFMRQHKIAVRP
ncbi:MAG TPA: c-type cytochrome [Gemmatimonadaceae bacterium]|nr:c-type cytochrome [Gemmatimonadaceae bacterium]